MYLIVNIELIANTKVLTPLSPLYNNLVDIIQKIFMHLVLEEEKKYQQNMFLK